MEIKYTNTEEDYVKFNLFHVKNSKTAMKALHIQRIIGPIIFFIFTYVFSKLDNSNFLVWFIPFFILSILWVIFYPKYFYRHITRMAKKMIKEGKNEGLLGEHRMIFTDEGIEDHTSNGQTKVNWTGITEFKEDDANFYLYNSSVSAYILPKRDLENAVEMKNYLRSKLTHLEKI